MDKIQHLVILSGGLDSSTILAKVIDENDGEGVNAIHFYYGQRHQREKQAAKKIAEFYKIPLHHLDLSNIFSSLKGNALTDIDEVEIPEGHYTDPSMRLTVVPFRNLMFLSSGAAFAASVGASTLHIGVHAGDHAIYPDCRPEFIHAARKVLKLGHYDAISLKTPFLNDTKAGIVKSGIRLGVPYELTWTCYQGESLPCGKCGACAERSEAFSENGVRDPL